MCNWVYSFLETFLNQVIWYEYCKASKYINFSDVTYVNKNITKFTLLKCEFNNLHRILLLTPIKFCIISRLSDEVTAVFKVYFISHNYIIILTVVCT